MNQVYTERRDLMVDALNNAGFEVESPKATFYLWIKVPEGHSSGQIATLLLEKAGLVVTPGNGFGDPGEGYFRIALTQTKERLAEAIDRLKEIDI
jgi:LL-diaminopimelate aminotransferase